MAAPAVVAVSSNPAVDRLAVVRDARAGGVRRATAALETAGGKAAHVVAVARALGADARLVTAADATYARLLDVPAEVVPAARTRGTFTLVDAEAGDVVEVHEPAEPLDGGALAAAAAHAAAGAAVVVTAGSLAPGVPEAFHADVVRAAAGAFTVVDTSSPGALRAALAAGPSLVAPNRGEAEALLGAGSPAELARGLRAEGAAWAWISLGPDGTLLAGPDDVLVRLRAPAPARVANAVGAGDALVGGLAAGLARGLEVPEAARLGVAAATDKVTRLGFTEVDPAAVERLAPHVVSTPA